MAEGRSKPAKTQRQPKTDPIRWGILGCGSIATHAICPALRWSKIIDLAAVASRDRNRAQEKMRETQARKAYGSYQELLDDPEIDVVYIGVPNGNHEEWVVKAALAGKHILCEKSLSLTSAGARRMVDAANQAGVLLMEAFMYRHHPQWDTLRALLQSGKIGEVKMVRAGLFGELQDTDNHRWSAELGGGALYDVTCYGINLARMIYRREPISVIAVADTRTREKVDRTSSAVMDFGFGRLASVAGSLSTFNHQYCEIEGTQGRITVEHPFIPGWERTDLVVQHGMTSERIEITGANHFLHQVEHLSMCVQNPSRPLEPAENGLLQTLVNEAVEQSWLAGRVVEVPEA